MIFISLYVRLLLCSALFGSSYGSWFSPPSLGNTTTSRIKKELHCDQKKINSHDYKEHCDENQLLLQLARLYVISPERIILLLTMDSLADTCRDIADVLVRINTTLASCIPLPSDNLYMKLHHGLSYFNSFICGHNDKSRRKHLNNYHECLRELRDDLLDCEGPPDWFEKRNKSIVCQFYNDIVNCNYIKAGMLCGLKTALLLRTFSGEIMKRVVKHKCKVARSLPHIDDPMPLIGSRSKVNKCSNYIHLFLILFLYIFN